MTFGIDDLLTPALLIDLEKVRHNVRRTLDILGGDASRWRPHIKTGKIAEVFDLLLDAGVVHFKCATTKEARVLLSRGRSSLDLLVAMAHYGQNLRAIAALAREHPHHRLSILSEDPHHAALVRSANPDLGIFVDLNPGYHRTGIPLADRRRIDATIHAAGEALRGLHYYDGHLHGSTPAERRDACHTIYGELGSLLRELPSSGLEVVTSGTPTFPVAAQYEPFQAYDHKVSPGTVVYWDTQSQALGIDGYEYAATVLARVISHPNDGRVTLDAGSKAVDAAAGDPCCIVQHWPGLRAERPSEEHLPLTIEAGDGPEPGSLVHLVPRHVCPTVNLADDAVLTNGDQIIDIVPVAARGHDTSG